MSLTWTDQTMGRGASVSGNSKESYAQASAQIQAQIDKGHAVDKSARDILEKARSLGVFYG